ncbi:MAG: hypothetical protein OXF00_11175 [bacterium]|nr:hypothetical protein [bacterium]
MSFRWRLLAAAVVLAVTLAAVFALSRRDGPAAEVPAVAASQRWAAGHPPGRHAVVNVPADLAVLFVSSEELAGAVAAVDVPEGAMVSPQMLRRPQPGDASRTTALMQFSVSAELWPDPGPAAGSQAVFSSSPGGCAAALATLLSAVADESSARVTVEATPELAAALSDGQWWIWESPPGGWPRCEQGGRD